MKRVVSLVSVIIMGLMGNAQQSSLQLSTEKTISLIFPFPVVHVDRGTSDVLVESVKKQNNILLVKAAAKGFPETNLTAVTSDGSLYSFRVCYAERIKTWVYQLPVKKGPAIETIASRLLDNPPIAVGMKAENGGVTVRVTGIYIHGPHLFFQLQFRNDSPIAYEVDFIRCFLRDKKQSKRTAIQEVEYTPLAIAGDYSRVESFGERVVVIALDKFTVPDAEHFMLQVGEKGTGVGKKF